MDRGLSRFHPKRGQREATGEFSEPDSEGTVFEFAGWSLSSPLCGCFMNAEEFHVRLDKEMLCGHHAPVRSKRMC